MKRRMMFGALLVSVAMCGQGFGFELLDNLLGLNRGGSACCPPQCCEPVACDPACDPVACDPVCDPGFCDPGVCGQACCPPAGCDLFAGLKGLFASRRACCGQVTCCDTMVTAACDPSCGPACDPACVDPGCVDPGCCVPQCGRRCTPILDFIGDLFRKKPCHAPCCGPVQWVGSACCEPTCCPTTCGAAAPAYDEAAPQPAVAPEAAPAENGEQPGKLPAPKPNGQASVNFRSLIRN